MSGACQIDALKNTVLEKHLIAQLVFLSLANLFYSLPTVQGKRRIFTILATNCKALFSFVTTGQLFQ